MGLAVSPSQPGIIDQIMKQEHANLPTHKLIYKATYDILDHDTRDAWQESAKKFCNFTTSQYSSGEKILSNPDSLPIYIVMATIICNTYFHGHNPGNLIMLIAVELVRVVKDFGNIRTKNIQNKRKLVDNYITQLVKGTQTPSQALAAAKSGVQLANPVILDNYKKNYQTQTSKKKKRNKKFVPHFCKGENCDQKNCSFFSG